ncbi:MAG: hypothetical protein DHS20C08_07540 [Rhodomicrobium sp.]|nr:MAG: hypothetical protein DHS20C08_07540 [Rhodomicrobium sp.]
MTFTVMRPYLLATGILLISSLGIGGNLLAAEEKTPAAKEAKSETVEFNEAEMLVFETNHMKTAKPGQTLAYNFERVSKLGDGFTDSVELLVNKGEGAGEKQVELQFFTGERRRPYPSFGHVEANPLLTVFFNKDAWGLARRIKAKGTANYLRNRIIDGFHDVKKIEEATCEVNGAKVPGKLIRFQPFASDKNAHHLVHYHAIEYRITLSPDVPGGVCSIQSVIADQKDGVPDYYIARLKKQGMRDLASEAAKVNKSKGDGEPIIVETLSYVGVSDSSKAGLIKKEGE